MSHGGTLNNQIVESLRRGSREAVLALVSFGVSPTKEIDLVLASGASAQDGITTKSAWFWSHQSSSPGAVEAWWEWVDRTMHNMKEEKRSEYLAKLFAEGVEASLPYNGNTLWMSWEKAIAWGESGEAPGWTRQVMMAHLTSCCSKLGNACIPGLLSLELKGAIGKSDWTMKSRQKYARDPLTVAINKGQVELVETLLDMGCEPLMQSGGPIIAEVWNDFRESAEKNDSSLPGEFDAPLILMEKLLVRDIDWNVPLVSNKEKTIAEDAEGWIDLLKALPSKWESVSHQIEARILSKNTVPSTRASLKHRL